MPIPGFFSLMRTNLHSYCGLCTGFLVLAACRCFQGLFQVSQNVVDMFQAHG